jgi:hypothetical protein
MIRRLSSNRYCLHPRRTRESVGEWIADRSKVRLASGRRRRAMQVFKQARPGVSLQPRRITTATW